MTAAVEDILSDSLGMMIQEWFMPTLKHPFLEIQNIPGATMKDIPHLWVDDIQIDDLFNADDGDLPGGATWSPEEGRQRLNVALERLGLKLSDLSGTSDKNREPSNEKSRVKQELKRYDTEFQKLFSRPPSHSEKEPMRPLYVYYRRLKTLISQSERKLGSKSGDNTPRLGGLESIPEQEEAETPQSRTRQKAQSIEDQILKVEGRIESLHNEKASIRSKLQTFQERFVSENNRKIRFHKDILPIEREYRMYKNLKEEIQKAETQLAELNKLQSS